MNITNPDPETKRIELQGECSVEFSSELSSQLLDGFKNYSHLELSLNQITEADLTIIQLLCSAHKSSQSGSKDIRIIDQVPDSVSNTMLRAGYFLCCQRCPVKTCFLREALSDE